MRSVQDMKAAIIERNFFRPAWYSIFLNPYFIARSGLYRHIKEFAARTSPEHRVLDIGCGIKPYRLLFRSSTYIGIDIEGGGHSDESKAVDIFYDGINIPFPDTSFEAVLSTQVLEHADSPESLVSEAYRVLSPGGRVLFSMPFMYPEHEVPFDFRRFTRYEHERLMRDAGFHDIRVLPTTGLFGTIGQIFIVTSFESIRFRAPLLKALLTIGIFAPIQAISLLLDRLFGKPGPTLDYVVTGLKV